MSPLHVQAIRICSASRNSAAARRGGSFDAGGRIALRKGIVRWCSRTAVFPLLLAAIPAFAASQSDYDDCMQHADMDRTIAGCTAIIDDVAESNRNRRIAYDNRGVAWHTKGDNDRAIGDYTEAVRLNPKDPVAYDNRGTAWRDKGDLDRALADYNRAIALNSNNVIAYNNRGNVRAEKGDNKSAVADYTEAIRLDPKYAVAYVNRGLAWYAVGDNTRAIADSVEAIRLDPNNAMAYRIRGYAGFGTANFVTATQDLLRANELSADPYVALWLFIARGRLGENGAAELAANAARSSIKDWPAPVIDFYLGQRSFEEMRGAATNPGQRCEAAFYGGEWLLLLGNSRQSKVSLQAAARICSNTSKEYSGATAELKRMKH
jgi:tetratricopeptide (TPR) repeat protein